MASRSVAGSDIGGNKKRRASTLAKEEKQFLSKLADELDDTETDLAYIMSELRGAQSHHVDRVAKMLRKGTFDKMLREEEGEEEEELDDRIQRYRQLKVSHMTKMITTWHPQLQDRAGEISNLGRPKLLLWITYALCVKETMPLPSEYPTLRNMTILSKYMEARYIRMGSRLSSLVTAQDIATTTISPYFVLHLETNIVECTVLKNGDGSNVTYEFPFVNITDWVMSKSYTTAACISSNTLSSTVTLAGRMQSSIGVTLPTEDSNWNLTPQELPACVIGGPPVAGAAAAVAPAPRAQSSGARAPRAPPGSGAAKGRAKAKASS